MNQETKVDFTPLAAAAISGSLEAVIVLAMHGAKLDQKMKAA